MPAEPISASEWEAVKGSIPAEVKSVMSTIEMDIARNGHTDGVISIVQIPGSDARPLLVSIRPA